MMRTYLRMKHNEPIVFLPGWGFHSTIWSTIANKIKNHPSHLYDLPILDNYINEKNSCLKNIASKINHALPDNAILVAWSLGGLLATFLCYQFPKKYKKLIVIAYTPKFVEEKNWKGVNHQLIDQFHTNIENNLPELFVKFHQLVSYPNCDHGLKTLLKLHACNESDKITLLRYLNILANADMRFIFNKIKIPVLQIFGTSDAILSHAITQQIKTTFPRFALQMIDGAGHSPFLSHTTDFINCLTSFIDAP